MRTIFHAHNWKFNTIGARLPELAAAGFDAIQISPAQKSPPGDAWYLRYQPLDYLVIDGLGNGDELQALCAAAGALGVSIIGDVVFNHMAVREHARRHHWIHAIQQEAIGNTKPLKTLLSALDNFPHLSRADFQPWRDMNGEDWDNEHRYESWGNGEWPELKPTPKVLELHRRHLELLYDCGVRGFRFDAVKHMRPEHLANYVEMIKAFEEPCWTYGEVLSENLLMHKEYSHLFPTTDFPYITWLKSKLRSGDPFDFDVQDMFHSSTSIRFGLNHDLVLNPPEIMSGLLFGHPQDTRLASCLALLTEGGTNLIYADCYDQDALIQACVKLRSSERELMRAGTVYRGEGHCTFQSPSICYKLDFCSHRVSVAG